MQRANSQITIPKVVGLVVDEIRDIVNAPANVKLSSDDASDTV
jgi:hypothetical protein